MNHRSEFSTLNAQQQASLDKHREMIGNATRFNTQIAENRDRVQSAPTIQLRHVVATIVSVFGLRS